MAQAITVTAPAKVNLHLGIYPGRDERGYHRADSVMIALELADEVTVLPAEGLEVTCEPPLDVPAEKTTIAKAAQRLAAAFGVPCNARIHLVRRIPDKSGMGSASTDSAATLRALCQLWGLDEGDPRVLEIARGLGADVAFFLQPVPSLLVGVGDVLREAFPPLVGMPLVLVRPEGGVSTPAAYAEFDREPSEPCDPEPLCAALRTGDADAVAAHIANNLGEGACRLEPEERVVVDWLRAAEGVVSAQVTGSGSCVFGICESPEAAASVAAAAEERGWWSCATATV